MGKKRERVMELEKERTTVDKENVFPGEVEKKARKKKGHGWAPRKSLKKTFEGVPEVGINHFLLSQGFTWYKKDILLEKWVDGRHYVIVAAGLIYSVKGKGNPTLESPLLRDVLKRKWIRDLVEGADAAFFLLTHEQYGPRGVDGSKLKTQASRDLVWDKIQRLKLKPIVKSKSSYSHVAVMILHQHQLTYLDGWYFEVPEDLPRPDWLQKAIKAANKRKYVKAARQSVYPALKRLLGYEERENELPPELVVHKTAIMPRQANGCALLPIFLCLANAARPVAQVDLVLNFASPRSEIEVYNAVVKVVTPRTEIYLFREDRLAAERAQKKREAKERVLRELEEKKMAALKRKWNVEDDDRSLVIHIPRYD